MIGAGNIANYSVVVKSWLSDKNLQAILYKINTITNNNMYKR